jgi:hypothetical protein
MTKPLTEEEPIPRRPENHSKQCRYFHPDFGPDYGCNCGGDLEDARVLVVELRAEVRRSRQPAGRTYVERAREWLRSFAPRVALGDDGSDGMYHEEDYQSLARLLEATERAAVEKAAKIAEGDNPAGAFSTAIAAAIRSQP